MIIVKRKRKIEDYQLRELKIGGLLINPDNLELKYLYEKPSSRYITLQEWENNDKIILLDEEYFYLAEIIGA